MIRRFICGALGCVFLLSGPAHAEKMVVAFASQAVSFAPVFTAKALGYFDRVGLDVELLKMTAGVKAAAAVVSGDAQAYIGSSSSVLNAQRQGADLVAFGSIVSHFIVNVVVSKKWAADHNLTQNSSYEDRLKALKGIRIALTDPSSGPTQLVRLLARDAALDADRDMQFVFMNSDISTNLAAMQADQVDGFALSTPAPEMAEMALGTFTLFNPVVGDVKSLKDFTYIAAIGSSKWLKANPETATKFLTAVQLALNDLRTPEVNRKAKEATKSYFGALDPAILDRVWSDLDKVMPQTIEETKPLMLGLIEFSNLFEKQKVDPATVEDFFTNEYAAKAVERVRSGAVK